MQIPMKLGSSPVKGRHGALLASVMEVRCTEKPRVGRQARGGCVNCPFKTETNQHRFCKISTGGKESHTMLKSIPDELFQVTPTEPIPRPLPIRKGLQSLAPLDNSGSILLRALESLFDRLHLRPRVAFPWPNTESAEDMKLQSHLSDQHPSHSPFQNTF